MFLRATTRKKDGKEHRYWSIVENRRLSDGRVLQRHVLYLGEINASQELAWRKSIEVFEDGAKAPRTLALFPEDRCEGMVPDEAVVRLRLTELRLCRPRQWVEFPPFRGRFTAWDSSRALRWLRVQCWTYPPLVVDG